VLITRVEPMRARRSTAASARTVAARDLTRQRVNRCGVQSRARARAHVVRYPHAGTSTPRISDQRQLKTVPARAVNAQLSRILSSDDEAAIRDSLKMDARVPATSHSAPRPAGGARAGRARRADLSPARRQDARHGRHSKCWSASGNMTNRSPSSWSRDTEAAPPRVEATRRARSISSEKPFASERVLVQPAQRPRFAAARDEKPIAE